MGHGKSTVHIVYSLELIVGIAYLHRQYINNLLGPDATKLAPVSGGFKACTSECCLYAWHPGAGKSDYTIGSGQRVFLVDTPGFDDALTVGEIISEVASCIQPLWVFPETCTIREQLISITDETVKLQLPVLSSSWPPSIPD